MFFGESKLAYRTLLVYLAAEDSARRVLDAALQIANQHDAHVVALHVIPKVPIYSVFGVPAAHDVLSKHEGTLRAQATAIEQVFSEWARSNARNVKCEWRESKAYYQDLAIDVLRDAVSADLVIMSKDPADPFDAWSDLPARIILGSGRPVLLVPTEGQFGSVGKRPLIAWKQTREAARAAFDALPLLVRADAVDIFAAVSEDESEQPISGEELALALARHDVKATVTGKELKSSDVGQEILDQIEASQHDLLVMGCYGHSELRELVFGGVTRLVLKHMTVPVLMSH